MSNINPNASRLIDEYIEGCRDFSKPILSKIRTAIHKADPAINEDWKWGPLYKKKGLVCGFAGFKEHVSLAFFHGASMNDPYKLFTDGHANALIRVIKFNDVKELNEELIIEYVKEAVRINEAPAAQQPAKKKPSRQPAGNTAGKPMKKNIFPTYK